MMTNKKLIYSVLIIAILLILLIVGIILFRSGKPIASPISSDIKSGNVIMPELERLNIEITGQSKEVELQLPSILSDANWGLKKIICEEGGYDLTKYAGRDVLITSYSINNEVYKQTTKFGTEELPLKVSIITANNEVICVYKIASDLIPGVLSIKDPFIIKK